MAAGSRDHSTTGRLTRHVANGCLVLLMIPVALCTYLWYQAWHTGHVNTQREHAAMATVLGKAQHASDSTARALNSTRATAPDALTAVIWRHTHAPVIVYDPTHSTYTATTSWSATYSETGFVITGGPTRVERCFTLTYSRTAGAAWTTKLAERHDDPCASGRSIAREVDWARDRIANMTTEEVSQAKVAQALAPTDRLRDDVVKKVVRHDGAAVVVVLVRDGGVSPPLQQCYAITRRPGADDARSHAVTAVPVATC
ncbi:hypothetical protein [Streptomyces montanisoli]|uniref:Uncharacterized protein n=1 Tax=Streptomyces montanisoli TaxID=2798581 RepID=A0A940RYB3_9ACTN|nr:hypothetical protein [Streptomyces montanisoli]MBP0459008.1 hypothetical protein [Streptomyces montanisoli]